MITTKNFEKALLTLGFTPNGSVLEKKFPVFDCSLKVDFRQGKLIYPAASKGCEHNDRFIYFSM